MGKGLTVKILSCVVMLSFALCGYLNARNKVTKLMIKLPRAIEELTLVEEKNTILQFQVDKFENPTYLLNLLKTKEYAYLLEKVDMNNPSIEIAVKGPEKEPAQKSAPVQATSSKTVLGSMFK